MHRIVIIRDIPAINFKNLFVLKAGLIKTKRGDYWVEPSKHHPATDDGHPHIVFQKSIGKNKVCLKTK